MATGSFKLPISSSSDWVRPSDWLPMPTGITSANDTFVGLYAIFPEGQNYAAFLFTTSAGQYRVDWGDGTITLHNSGTIAQYQYDYATISNSTLTSRGYKQSMITVTAVSGLLRTIDLQRAFVTTPAQTTAYASGFLDCILSMPNASASSSITLGGSTVRQSYCERFDIKTIGACNSLASLFSNFFSLQSVPLFNTSNVTNMAGMFSSCVSIRSIPLFNTQNVTNMSTMFINCQTLKTVPLFNTSNVTTMVNMFNTCSSLREVPLFNTQNVTTMENLFSSCNSLQSAPLFNTQNANNLRNMFFGCSSINSIPIYITPLITTTTGNDFGGIFQNCVSLDRIQMSFSRTVSINSAQLSRTALVEIFNNLVNRSATTSATINISTNWGASALTVAERLIATSKNWVIVG